MSFLVELPLEQYRSDAFAEFRPTSDFSIGNAKAMAWIAQLSYETADPSKMAKVLQTWGLTSEPRLLAGTSAALSPGPIRGFVVSSCDSSIVGFAGTDPLSLIDWVADLDIRLSVDSIQRGLWNTLDSVWATLVPLLESAASTKSALYLSGHSLGGALAIVAASRAARELGINARAVYTIGSLRAGRGEFATDYPLGEKTFRLVYGDDVISALPPLSLGFRHVGQMVYCPHGQTFLTASISAASDDQRHFDATVIAGISDELRSRFQASRFSLRSWLVRLLFRALPVQITDHIPDSYLRALP